MNNLLSEILHNIFIHVPFKQRLECTRVCRHWYNCLVERSLLYDVIIIGDGTFYKFMGMLQRQPNRASQVQIINLYVTCSFDKRKLYNMLPNLRVFQFIDDSFTRPSPKQYKSSFKLTNTNSKLERIYDAGECELTRQWLMFSLCNHLRALYLRLYCVDNPRKDVFIYLKSAPALKELQLSHWKSTFGIEDLEIIHENAPVLENLEICRADLLSGDLPVDIMPVSTLRSFIMRTIKVKDNHDCPTWYRYLVKKYTNLSRFDGAESWRENFDAEHLMEMNEIGKLSVYKSNDIPIPYLDVLDVSTDLNPFHTLDKLGLRVSQFMLGENKTRPIFEQLAESNQSKYVELIYVINTAINSPINLQNFTSLVTIEINNVDLLCRWNVNLIDYFNAFPTTLKTFQAQLLDVEINELPSHPNNIEYLMLRCSTLYPKLAEIISSYLPKLNKLELHGRVTENLGLNLPPNKFRGIEIKVRPSEDQPHGFSITAASEPQQIYYIGEREYDNDKYATAEEMEDRVVINVSFLTASYLTCDDLHISY